MSSVALRAESGRELGSAASRRLRREGKVPAILYGHGTDPLTLAVDHREFVLSLRGDAGRNTIFALELDGTVHTALALEVERHPFRNEVRHVDGWASNGQVVHRSRNLYPMLHRWGLAQRQHQSALS